MNRLITIAFLALVAAAVPALAQAPEHTIVSLPAENFGFLPFYVAQDQHIFEQQGLEVQKVVLSGVATTNGVISGAADFGFSNGASLTRAAARGQRLLGIAIMSDKPVWAILMSKKLTDENHFDPGAPLAERAKLFQHVHTFAIDSVNSVGHALTRVIEKIGGVDPESLPVTPLGPPEAIAAFSRGSIDGWVSNPPWSEQILAMGTAVIVANSFTGDPPWMTPFGSGVVITRPRALERHHHRRAGALWCDDFDGAPQGNREGGLSRHAGRAGRPRQPRGLRRSYAAVHCRFQSDGDESAAAAHGLPAAFRCATAGRRSRQSDRRRAQRDREGDRGLSGGVRHALMLQSTTFVMPGRNNLFTSKA